MITSVWSSYGEGYRLPTHLLVALTVSYVSYDHDSLCRLIRLYDESISTSGLRYIISVMYLSNMQQQ